MKNTEITSPRFPTYETQGGQIREFNLAELEQVVGGAVPEGWKYCAKGTTAGGGPGLYPAWGSVVCKD